MTGLIGWLRQEAPSGLEAPLNWTNRLLEHLNEQSLVNETQAADFFFEVLHGGVRLEELPRIRVRTRSIQASGEWRYLWSKSVLGLELMNDLREIRIDGKLVDSDAQIYWNSPSFGIAVPLTNLAPGMHSIEFEVYSAMMRKEDLEGLSNADPPQDWPAAVKGWSRMVSAEFQVYDHYKILVNLTDDPALDPLNNGSLSIGGVLVQSNGNGWTHHYEKRPSSSSRRLKQSKWSRQWI